MPKFLLPERVFRNRGAFCRLIRRTPIPEGSKAGGRDYLESVHPEPMVPSSLTALLSLYGRAETL